ESAKGVVAILKNRGYAYAEATPHAVVDLGPRRADLTFRVETGIPCKVGPLTFDGVGDLPEPLIRRAFGVRTGDSYAEAERAAGRRALIDLGVFASVEVVPDLSNHARADVPVTVRVTRSALRGFRLGGGLQIDTNRADIHGLIGWEHRNLFGGMR